MIYLSPGAMETPKYGWGYLLSPRKGASNTYGKPWAIDNDAFTGFDLLAFFAYLDLLTPNDKCLFVACPDAVGNAPQTIQLYKRYAGDIHLRGYPVAFVAQDGMENYSLPTDYDALFIGGSTKWKMSPFADALITQAKRAGKWVHVGRVNSNERIRHFQLVGVDSVDGTGPAFEPDAKIKRFQKQLLQNPLLSL